MSQGRLGVAIVRLDFGYGLITDGDIRRLIEQYQETVFSKTAREFMSFNPASVMIGTRIEDALALMEQRKITSLLVLDGDEVVGVFKK